MKKIKTTIEVEIPDDTEAVFLDPKQSLQCCIVDKDKCMVMQEITCSISPFILVSEYLEMKAFFSESENDETPE